MQFFTSPEDLKKWVKNQKSADQATLNLLVVTNNNNQQDIKEACNLIVNEDLSDAAVSLYNILAKYNITREGNMSEKMIKEAQMMRQDSVYGNLELKVCPKLPHSVGKGLISSYNCRHYCLDGITFDDDPNRVYCGEAIWRRHIMDKFARDFQDKDGKLVGGYINERFQTFRDDGGNPLELKNGVKTNKPRPHQFSTERRLEEARGEKTTDITASSNKVIKLASTQVDQSEDVNLKIFDDVIEMKEAGLSDEDILMKTAEHYKTTIQHIASVYKTAKKMLQRYNGTVYACDNSKLQKVAVSTLPASENTEAVMISQKYVPIITLDGKQGILDPDTSVVQISEGVLKAIDGKYANVEFTLNNSVDVANSFEYANDMYSDAEDLGLNEPIDSLQPEGLDDDFPVTEI
jgi:hypothetical protein